MTIPQQGDVHELSHLSPPTTEGQYLDVTRDPLFRQSQESHRGRTHPNSPEEAGRRAIERIHSIARRSHEIETSSQDVRPAPREVPLPEHYTLSLNNEQLSFIERALEDGSLGDMIREWRSRNRPNVPTDSMAGGSDSICPAQDEDTHTEHRPLTDIELQAFDKAIKDGSLRSLLRDLRNIQENAGDNRSNNAGDSAGRPWYRDWDWHFTKGNLYASYVGGYLGTPTGIVSLAISAVGLYYTLHPKG